jgi:hypothetical protein
MSYISMFWWAFLAGFPQTDDDVMVKHVTGASSDLEAFAVDPSCIAYRSLLYKEQEEDQGSADANAEIVTIETS